MQFRFSTTYIPSRRAGIALGFALFLGLATPRPAIAQAAPQQGDAPASLLAIDIPGLRSVSWDVVVSNS